MSPFQNLQNTFLANKLKQKFISLAEIILRNSTRKITKTENRFTVNFIQPESFIFVKGTVMQIEKSLINDPLRVSKVSWKFQIPAIYNFVVIYP